MNFQKIAYLGCVSLMALCTLSSGAIARSQANKRIHYDIDPQNLGSSLHEISRQSGREIIAAAEAIAGQEARALSGDFTADEAIRQLLQGTDLIAEYRNDIVIIRRRKIASSDAVTSSEERNDAIFVTGSRIRGSSIASPVTVRTQKDMHEAGQFNFGDVARSLPQNFMGGQGPTLASGAENFGSSNVNSGTALNLRGLGPDATLTLINGKRLAYNSIRQAVDITEIPIAAVDRLEIVADGASALYGSDAIGGVANVILKKDYNGLTSSARFGVATEGGYVQKQIGAVAGQSWDDGGFIVTGDLTNNSAIQARQRSYTEDFDGSYTLYPNMRFRGAVFSGHQKVIDGISLNLDGIFSERRSDNMQYPLDPEEKAEFYGYINDQRTRSFTLSPGIDFDIGSRWIGTVTGVYGNELSSGYSEFNYDGNLSYASISRFENITLVADAGIEGPLFRLPAGEIRLATGGGYRNLVLHQKTLTVGSVPTLSRASQNSYSAYAELFVPLISSSMDIEGIESLSLNGALRYEKYSGLEKVATPKFGLVYAPASNLELKASWGRSFKTPALFQLFRDQPAVLAPMSYLTGDYPASATFLYIYGGNRSLKPERATTWTTTAKWSPEFLNDGHIELSYFRIGYRDRVAEPFRLSQALLPEYAQYLTYAPDRSTLSAAIARSSAGLINYTDGIYDPAQVVAIVDTRYVNATSQVIQGIDGSIRYTIPFPNDASLILTGSATYLRSSQRLAIGQPSLPIAGTIYRPPHWRANVGAIWHDRALTFGTFINYVGEVLALLWQVEGTD